MAFEWDEVRLDEVAELNGGYAFKSEDYTSSGRFVLRTVNITESGRITREGATFVDEGRAEEYERFSLKPMDTLFVMVGATLGKTGIITPRDLPALLNQNMWVVRANPLKVNPLFLHYCFTEASKTQVGFAFLVVEGKYWWVHRHCSEDAPVNVTFRAVSKGILLSFRPP